MHAQLAKEVEMRSPSGAAASRMETEAPSPAASSSVVARRATVAANEDTHLGAWPLSGCEYLLLLHVIRTTLAQPSATARAAGNAGSVERFRERAKGVMSGAEGRGRARQSVLARQESGPS